MFTTNTTVTFSTRIDAMIDELILIDDCLHGENVNCYIAYAAFLDFQGDLNAIAASENTIVPGDFIAAVNLLREITKGYYVDRYARQFVLDW